jgi:SAM-dependent methyltransferase
LGSDAAECLINSSAEQAMRPSVHERNRRAFDDPEAAAYYAQSYALTPCELRIFEAFVPDGSDILDLGVGAGRTTPYLSDKARNYVGIDYAPAMVEECRSRFPELRFDEADAVVFSFNGIDYLSPDDRRERCLAECHRVLRPDGVLIVSRHNPRAIVRLPPPGAAARGVAGLVRSIVGVPVWTLRRTVRLAVGGRRAFWSGRGTVVEPAAGFNSPLLPLQRRRPDPTGDLVTHMATPRRAREELTRLGFEVASVAGSTLPRSTGVLSTPWYYFAARKR